MNTTKLETKLQEQQAEIAALRTQVLKLAALNKELSDAVEKLTELTGLLVEKTTPKSKTIKPVGTAKTTVAQLKELAKAQKIKGYYKMNKQQLIADLKASKN